MSGVCVACHIVKGGAARGHVGAFICHGDAQLGGRELLLLFVEEEGVLLLLGGRALLLLLVEEEGVLLLRLVVVLVVGTSPIL